MPDSVWRYLSGEGRIIQLKTRHPLDHHLSDFDINITFSKFDASRQRYECLTYNTEVQKVAAFYVGQKRLISLLKTCWDVKTTIYMNLKIGTDIPRYDLVFFGRLLHLLENEHAL